MTHKILLEYGGGIAKTGNQVFPNFILVLKFSCLNFVVGNKKS